jgi:hypothetical protein
MLISFGGIKTSQELRYTKWGCCEAITTAAGMRDFA